MMGPRHEAQGAMFYEFSLEDHIPGDRVLRSIDRFVDLSGIRGHPAPHYRTIGRPPIDPELMIRMLLIGYCMGVRTEPRQRGSPEPGLSLGLPARSDGHCRRGQGRDTQSSD